MSLDYQASQDFEWARAKAFWRRVRNWLVGEPNQLLPLDEVRQRVEVRGQHYAGLRQVPIDSIVGSSGRYMDFDRAFLPVQGRTRDRWVSIDKAHYQDIILPPVDLYQIGEVFFVKDGNHRVSVARERGQVFIDAYVIVIDVPVPVTPEASLDELALRQERYDFLRQTELAATRPEAQLETGVTGQFQKLMEHINVHRWYMGEQQQAEASLRDAAASWYDQIYLPLVEMIRQQNILRSFPGYTETDLYLWVVEFQRYLRETYRSEAGLEPGEASKADRARRAEAGRQVADDYPLAAVRKLVGQLQRSEWVSQTLLNQERAGFFRATRANELFPLEPFSVTIPGQYERLVEHIRVHRWYLGEQRKAEATLEEAVRSWYENLYRPLVDIVREQGILADFSGRSETDLYLWIMSHRWFLREVYGSELSVEQAAEQFMEDFTDKPGRKSFPKENGEPSS